MGKKHVKNFVKNDGECLKTGDYEVKEAVTVKTVRVHGRACHSCTLLRFVVLPLLH